MSSQRDPRSSLSSSKQSYAQFVDDEDLPNPERNRQSPTKEVSLQSQVRDLKRKRRREQIDHSHSSSTTVVKPKTSKVNSTSFKKRRSTIGEAKPPVEMSSKNPVSRRRIVAVDRSIQPRDPRYGRGADFESSNLHEASYSFLKDKQSEELKQLQQTYETMKRASSTSVETQRVKEALQRAESVAAKRSRDQEERGIVKKWVSDEQSQRKDGKQAFFLKKREKESLIFQERYKSLSGDRRRLNHVIERKRRKIANKEKRSLPNQR